MGRLSTRIYSLGGRMLLLVLTAALAASCGGKENTGEDEQVTTLGDFEVTARLVEIPGEFIDRPMYDYAHVVKYEILKVHRGAVDTNVIYVGHYNPLKPRDAVKDARVEDVGGTLAKIREGDVHRMALVAPIDEHYMGGIINKYFDQGVEPIYWAVWTNLASGTP